MQFSQTMLYIVIAFNILKVIIMVVIVWKLNYKTIVTIGDSIESFIQTPDTTTKDCCLISTQSTGEVWKSPDVRQARQFQTPKREPWFIAASRKRWAIFILL